MIYYTDGSCVGNGKAVNQGGFGIVTLDDDGNPIFTNGKSYKLRRHGNITTTDGLIAFRKLIAKLCAERCMF